MLLNLWYWGRCCLKDKRGLGTIEILIIVLVLVGIAFVFRTQIEALFDMIMDAIWDATPWEKP